VPDPPQLAAERTARATAYEVAGPALQKLGYDMSGETATKWRDMTLQADNNPDNWFTQQEGRTVPGTSALVPGRWAHWHRLYMGRPGEDMFREAHSIAEGDIELVSGRDMGWSSSPNASSCTTYLDRITDEITWYRRSGVTEYFSDWAAKQPGPVTEKDFVDRINGALVVVRSPDDGKGRFCNNLTGNGYGINGGLIQRPFKLPKVAQFLLAAKRGDWWRRKDMKKAFYQMRLKQEGKSRQQTGFICPVFKQLARFTVTVFGMGTGPEYLLVLATVLTAIAAHVAREVAEELERAGNLEIAKQLVRAADSLDAFADDFISAAEAMAGAILDLILTLEGEKLGVKWDPGKDIAGPKVNVLGADMDSETLTMGISATKASAYRGHLNAVIEQAKVGGALPRRVLEQLAGKLGFCTILSRWCTSFMANIWATLWPQGGGCAPPLTITVTKELLDDLVQFWLPVLAKPGSAWLRRSQWSCTPIGDARATEHHVSASDASGNYGIGGISEWEVFQRTYSDEESDIHITFKEMLSLTEMCIVEERRYANKRVLAECDNSGTISYVNRGGGPRLPGRNTMLRLALSSIMHNYDLRATHRSGEHMITTGNDGVSREKLAGAKALPGATGIKGVFNVDTDVGAAVRASVGKGYGVGATLRREDFRAPEKPADDLSHLRELEIHTLDGIRVHPQPGPAPGWTPGARARDHTWAHARCCVCQKGQQLGVPVQLLCRGCGRAAHAACLQVQVTGRREWLSVWQMCQCSGQHDPCSIERHSGGRGRFGARLVQDSAPAP